MSGYFRTLVFDPASSLYYYWLSIITFATLYNVVFVIGRGAFWELQNLCPTVWYLLDYFCDIIYIIDMFVKSRTGYLEQGLLQRDRTKLLKHYTSSIGFRMDMISVFPTDIFYLAIGTTCEMVLPCPVIVRLNRLFRFQRIIEFFHRTDSRTTFPYTFRIAKLISCILVIIHWNACLYFTVSHAIGFGSDDWVYANVTDPRNARLGHQYLYCFYWSTLILTTIGEVPEPEQNVEYLFVVIDFLVGVLVFATIVGNIGNMIASINASRSEFQKEMDNVKQYMEFSKVSPDLEERVIKWYDYLWTNKKSLDENAVTSALPNSLKTEIAIHVHLDTLKQVRIFQDCEPGFLVQLVKRLKLQLFSPGDYVCRKGDVGRELYIVKRGWLEVVSDDGQTVFATFCEGSVLGELSLLNIPGLKTGNRRTANIRSIGYSDLFCLSKEDLWEVLEEYPEAEKLLIERGRQILIKDGLLDEDMAKEVEVENQALAIKMERLECSMDVLQTKMSWFLDEFVESQNNLRKIVQKLERAVRTSDDSKVSNITEDEERNIPQFVACQGNLRTISRL